MYLTGENSTEYSVGPEREGASNFRRSLRCFATSFLQLMWPDPISFRRYGDEEEHFAIHGAEIPFHLPTFWLIAVACALIRESAYPSLRRDLCAVILSTPIEIDPPWPAVAEIKLTHLGT